MIDDFFREVQQNSERRKMEEQKRRLNRSSSRLHLPHDDKDVESRRQRKTWACLGMIVVTILLGGVVVSYLEDWSFIAGIFWAFQTVTTVGYGDGTIINHHSTILFAIVYALVSVAIVGGAFAGIAAAKEEAEAEKKRRDLLRRKLDVELLLDLSKALRRDVRSGEESYQQQQPIGLDRAEFLAANLCALGLVSEEHCAALFQRQ